MTTSAVLVVAFFHCLFIEVSAQSLDFCTYWRALNLEKTKPECVRAESISYCTSRGELFQECGSPCPPSCQNPSPTCVQQCASGCFCQTGLIRDYVSNRCITNSQCPLADNAVNLCPPLSSIGTDCVAYSTIAKCTNLNQCILTLNPVCCPTNCGFSVCMQLQAPFQNPCQMRPQLGTCAGAQARFYFNYANQRCEQFTYSGCGGNSNNFASLIECQAACPSNVYGKK